jgi:hypothetical protein
VKLCDKACRICVRHSLECPKTKTVNCLTVSRKRNTTILTHGKILAMSDFPAFEIHLADRVIKIYANGRVEGLDDKGKCIVINRIPRQQYNFADDFAKSIDFAYDHIRKRKANGGKGWRE